MQPVRILKTFFFLFVLIVFAACGNVSGVYDTANGGGIGGTGINDPAAGGGIGGTGISIGKITQIGSVWVNGVRFDTSSATIEVDGVNRSLGYLEVGMIVAVEGSFDADGINGTAKRVVFKDNLEGPVENVVDAQTLIVLGQTVIADSTTSVYDLSGSDTDGINKYTLASIGVSAGDMVEVSGFVDSTGAIHATYIKVEGLNVDAEIEIKGTISSLDETAHTFNIGALIIDYSSAQMEGISAPQNGLFVEVKSESGPTGGILTASKIEAEDEIFKISGGGEGETVEIEGIVTSPLSDYQFEVNGQPVQITLATQFEGTSSQIDIIPGARLEVEGAMDAYGVLVAEDISIESGGSSGEGNNEGSPDDELEEGEN